MLVTETSLEGTGSQSVGWIYLSQERHRLRALVHTVMNLRVTFNAGRFFNTLKLPRPKHKFTIDSESAVHYKKN